MASHPDYPRTRLYTEQNLLAGITVFFEEKQARYLMQVLRMKAGDTVALFNGRDGEFLGRIESADKKTVVLRADRQLRPYSAPSALWLLAAPLKHGKSETVLEKATELGITHFQPVATRFTVAGKINEMRFHAIATEAAEQCERLDVPTVLPLAALEKTLSSWPSAVPVFYGDESGQSRVVKDLFSSLPAGDKAVLIGPEGGFSTEELALFRRLPFATGFCMGPRVLRADTAAIAALALLQAWAGDWDAKPAFRA